MEKDDSTGFSKRSVMQKNCFCFFFQKVTAMIQLKDIAGWIKSVSIGIAAPVAIPTAFLKRLTWALRKSWLAKGRGENSGASCSQGVAAVTMQELNTWPPCWIFVVSVNLVAVPLICVGWKGLVYSLILTEMSKLFTTESCHRIWMHLLHLLDMLIAFGLRSWVLVRLTTGWPTLPVFQFCFTHHPTLSNWQFLCLIDIKH